MNGHLADAMRFGKGRIELRPLPGHVLSFGFGNCNRSLNWEEKRLLTFNSRGGVKGLILKLDSLPNEQ